jgi:DNA helicase II / ATP-dependent DNA helicase PcrA
MSARLHNLIFTPSAEQRTIVECDSHCLIVEANAGAAKTTTLALKAKSLLEKSENNAKILFLVFTLPAKEAALKALERVGASSSQMKRIDVLTFDEFSQRILRSVENQVIPFKSTAENVAPYVVRAMEELSMPNAPDFIEGFLKISRLRKGSMDIDRAKWADDYRLEEFAENFGVSRDILRLYSRYEKIRYDRESDDFDHAVFRSNFDATYDLAWLLADPEQRTPLHEMLSWPRHLNALLVDEMHDMNFAMSIIVKSLLATTSAQFCGVGDRDQVIFSNNGAEEKFMSRHADYGDRVVTLLPLTTCHRFGLQLAKIAARLAGGKKYAAQPGLETRVMQKLYAETGELGCKTLLMAQITQWKKENSNDMSNVALLLRHSWQSVEIENALIEKGIYYSTHGFQSYFIQPEVLLIRALHAIGTRDYTKLGTETLRRRMIETLIFFFSVELPREESEKETFAYRLNIAREAAVREGDMRLFIENILLKNCSEKVRFRVNQAISIFEKKTSAQNDFNEILKAIEIEHWVEEVFIEKQRKKDATAYFNALRSLSSQYKNIEAFLALLNDYENKQELSSLSENTQYLRASNLRRNTLRLALVSEVKGLEGVFPSDTAHSAQEERNLLYVAMTRAKKNLTLLICEKRPSRFLVTDSNAMAP